MNRLQYVKGHWAAAYLPNCPELEIPAYVPFGAEGAASVTDEC